jgi:hydrogenase expression/formation protein HypC
MCLGIPGEVVELVEGNDQLALVDVVGGRRHVNVGMLGPDALQPGDWVLIHLGFALEKISPAEARAARAGLEMLGQPLPPDDEQASQPA